MLNRIRSLFEARTEKKLTMMANRMFAFVEPRFDDIVETATQGVRASVFEAVHDRASGITEGDIEVALHDAATEAVDQATRYHDLDDIVREKIDEMVDDHYFEDFDDMAREKIDDRLDYDFDADEAAREAVDRWFNSNRDSIDDMVDRAIRQQLEETLEDAPHFAARLNEAEATILENARRLAQLAEKVAEVVSSLKETVETLDGMQDDFTADVRHIAREEVVGIVAQVGRILDFDSYHPEASE